MIVNTQKKIEFVNDCNCIVDYNELEKAILWYQNKPTSRLKHIYMLGEYPAVTIHKDKIHIHRLLMEYWLKAKLPRDYYVHHINKNKLDARKENLSLEYSFVHQSHHNKGKITPINFNKGSKNPKSKLNEKEVLNILECKNNGLSLGQVYNNYKDKISYKGIQNIWYGYAWKDLIRSEIYGMDNKYINSSINLGGHMTKEGFLEKIKELKLNVPDEQFFLEYNATVFDVLDREEKLINYLENCIEYEKLDLFWTSKKRLKIYQDILERVKSGKYE